MKPLVKFVCAFILLELVTGAPSTISKGILCVGTAQLMI